MNDLLALVASTYDGLADLLWAAPPVTWDAPTLCAGWAVRHVVAHVTMPTRLTMEEFGAEIAAAGGDFTAVSDRIAARDALRPAADQLAALHSDALHGWEPPGGGAAAALNHAVIHSLDITLPLEVPPVATASAMAAVLDQLCATDGAYFGIDLTDICLEATDSAWSWGAGRAVSATAPELVALLSGRTLPDGRALKRVPAA